MAKGKITVQNFNCNGEPIELEGRVIHLDDVPGLRNAVERLMVKVAREGSHGTVLEGR